MLFSDKHTHTLASIDKHTRTHIHSLASVFDPPACVLSCSLSVGVCVRLSIDGDIAQNAYTPAIHRQCLSVYCRMRLSIDGDVVCLCVAGVYRVAKTRRIP